MYEIFEPITGVFFFLKSEINYGLREVTLLTDLVFLLDYWDQLMG